MDVGLQLWFGDSVLRPFRRDDGDRLSAPRRRGSDDRHDGGALWDSRQRNPDHWCYGEILLDILVPGTNPAEYVSYVSQLSLSAFNTVSDAQQVSDGTMTAASVVLTSASGKFSPSDVGKIICVTGAGIDGYKLVTTIASYQSATQVTLAETAYFSVSPPGTNSQGIGVTWGTDNSPALQAALNHLTTITTVGANNGGGADLIIPSGNYCFGAEISWTCPTNYPHLSIIGQGASTKLFVVGDDGGTPGNYASEILLTITGVGDLKILNMLWIGTPGAECDIGILMVINGGFQATLDCDFYWLSPLYTETLIQFSTLLILNSRFRGCCGGIIVYGYQWEGFIDEGSLFVDWGTLDGVNQFAKALTDVTPIAAIYLGAPAQTAAASADFLGQAKVQFHNTYIDEDFGVPIIIDAPLNAISEVELDGVRINGPGTASTPAINIQGVQILTVNAWVGYSTVLVNDAIVLANIGTAHLKRFTAMSDDNAIVASSTVGTLILEDCVYTTLSSSASVTIVTQKGQVTPPTYTVDTLPAASAANKGFRANVSDQLTSLPAFGGALTGGGALLCPCWSNGTAWVAG